MRPFIAAIVTSILLASVVQARGPRYVVTDLGPLPGGHFSQAADPGEFGVVTGTASTREGTQHAVVWIDGRPFDIAGAGLGGANSAAFGINIWGQIAIQAETSLPDPAGEDFCGYGSHLVCRAALWQFGVLRMLPTLGGPNSTVGNINSRGQIAGIAETAVADASCSSMAPSQILRFQPVIWGPAPNDVHQLPLPGVDTVGMALGINDQGQAVGAAGQCGNTSLLPVAVGPHAVLWEKNGSVRDLGNLGAAAANVALAINNFGQVVGASSPTPDSGPFHGNHAFIWSQLRGMRDLGTLPGDVASGGIGINDAGEVVGVSNDAAGNIRAFHWQEGRGIEDLNALAPDAPVYLLFATAINGSGDIAGWGAHKATGEIHGFRATLTGAR